MTDRQTHRQTDRQTDARGKTIYLPTLAGGDINILWEKTQAMQHVVISAPVDRLLCQSEDDYL